MRSSPTFEFEEMLRHGGVEYIAGVDEAGRGPVAGPVTAAAVILPIGKFIENVRDSKQLTGNQRESVAAAIKENAVDFSVAHIPNETIDSVNILNATRLAVMKVIESLKIQPQVILIDGKFLNLKDRTCISIVKGDSTIFSIAAASILAKTSRDALMLGFAEEFPNYSFEKNKGYLTADHLQAIRNHGFSPIHRKSFSITL